MFGRVAALVESPAGIARLGVALCALTATMVALITFPGTIRDLDRLADRNSALNYDDREFAGGNGVVVDKAALYEARALIPRDESFRVVTGPLLKGKTDLTLDYIAGYATYFLLPRRPSASASWIVCYGCETTQWGDRFEILWQNDQGISVGRLQS